MCISYAYLDEPQPKKFVEILDSFLRLLGIADDLTGALEAGALLGAVVRFQAPLPDSRAAVVDIESRHLSSDSAMSRVFSLTPECQRSDLVYKKTDSTLRGNIEAEFRALAESWTDRIPHTYPHIPQWAEQSG